MNHDWNEQSVIGANRETMIFSFILIQFDVVNITLVLNEQRPIDTLRPYLRLCERKKQQLK